jgi:hypothetical protein
MCSPISFGTLAERMEIRFNKTSEKKKLAQSDFVFVWISTFVDNDLSAVRSNRRIDSRVVCVDCLVGQDAL